MTDLSPIAALSRAFAVLTPGPDRAPEVARRLDALWVLEALAAASPAADGGRLHLRIVDWLCRWVRAESPASTARRWPLGRLADLGAIRDRQAWRREAAFHVARLQGSRGNLSDWVATLPAPRADVQLAVSIVGRRSEAQRAVEWQGDAPAVPMRGAVIRAEPRHGWQGWPLDRDAGLPVGGWIGAWAPDLSGSNLQRCTLHGAHLAGARLAGAALEGAWMTQADLAMADLSGARLDRAVLEGADLRGADLSAASLQRAELSLADLRAACLDEAALQEACFRGADIAQATFAGAILDGADLMAVTAARIATTDLTPAQQAAARPVELPRGRAGGRAGGRPRPLPRLPG